MDRAESENTGKPSKTTFLEARRVPRGGVGEPTLNKHGCSRKGVGRVRRGVGGGGPASLLVPFVLSAGGGRVYRLRRHRH